MRRVQGLFVVAAWGAGAAFVHCGDDATSVPAVGGVDASFDVTTSEAGAKPDAALPPADAGQADASDDAMGDAAASDASDASDATACPVGQLACDGGCLPVLNDNQHCGSCIGVCSGAQTCFDGGCLAPVTGDAGAVCDPTARAAFATIVAGPGVYLVQGIPVNTSTPLSSTSFVRIADGGLDPTGCAADSGVTVPVAEYSMGVARAASSVYLLGGATSVQSQTAVYRAAVSDAGLGGFSAAALADAGSVALKTSRYGHAVLQTGGFVYVIGGWNGVIGSTSNTLASIERATLDETTGTFVTSFAPADDPTSSGAATLALPRFGGMLFRSGAYVYYLGGQTGVGTASVLHSEIQRATLDASGNLSSFTQVGTLPTALVGAGAIAVGGTLYLAGGATGYSNPNYALSNAVLAAPIAADGTLGTFVATGLTLPYANAFAGSVVLGRTLYMLEGLTGTGFTATTSIQSLTFP